MRSWRGCRQWTEVQVTGALQTPGSWGHTVLSCDWKTHEGEVSVDTGLSGLIGDRACILELFGDRIWLTSGREAQWEMDLTGWFNCRVLSFGLSWLFLCVCWEVNSFIWWENISSQSCLRAWGSLLSFKLKTFHMQRQDGHFFKLSHCPGAMSPNYCL